MRCSTSSCGIMPASIFDKAPPVPAALAIFLLLAVLFAREASVKEDLPVFLPVLQRPVVYVEMRGLSSPPGVYQFYDEATLNDVIKLTGVDVAREELEKVGLKRPLMSGDMLVYDVTSRNTVTLELRWMPAAHRLALGVPLHPDRMDRDDWLILPGIGEVLAERIERDRQKNGEYVHYEALSRVYGIGEKKIKAWEAFF